MADRMPRVLGVESTAHTFGVGVVDGDPQREDPDPRVLANERALYTPDEDQGTAGIHPREAAHHHGEVARDVLEAALAGAGLAPGEVDAVAVSRAPGLGPSLRAGATVARALALDWDVPLVGVNHCVAHLEVGRAVCGVEDPLLLYASGANTQVVAFANGRYRVVGETLDVGVGNFLDKLARRMGEPFPGGPAIERLAARGDDLLELPYSVKGMDVAFSGLLTAATKRLEDGADPEDVAFSVQETAYAMLTEVAERALAHVGKTDIVLGGGVACNERLAGMVNTMCAERGARAHRPPKPLLVDNGAMIAWTGAVRLAHDGPTPIEASNVDQGQRTDQVEVPWRRPGDASPDPTHGAEARVELAAGIARKARPAKRYRHPALDERLRGRRTRDEARLLARARRAGVATPVVLDVDPARAQVTMQRAPGQRARDALDGLDADDQAAALEALASSLARLHAAGVAHGDPTTSNVFLDGGAAVWIDFGLARATEDPEAHATDLHVLDEALAATHPGLTPRLDDALGAYDPPHREEVLARFDQARRRGRYREDEATTRKA
jgi:N6-L-threonylcarbamoyladenine synthase/protein kinase Bud32